MNKPDAGGQIPQETVISALLWALMHLGTLLLSVYVLGLWGIIPSLSLAPPELEGEALQQKRILGLVLVVAALADYFALYFMSRRPRDPALPYNPQSARMLHVVFALSPLAYLVVLYLVVQGILPV